jgi:CRP-like cAMP-binding protein
VKPGATLPGFSVNSIDGIRVCFTGVCIEISGFTEINLGLTIAAGSLKQPAYRFAIFAGRMFEPLIKYIKSHSATPLSESDIVTVKNAFTPKRFMRRQFLHQEKEVCKSIAFILRGAMRQYSVDSKGVEHIVGLSIENGWAGDRESFEMQAPSKYFVDAWEDTDALVITRVGVNSISAIPAIQEVKSLASSNSAIELLDRINASISLSAEERYAELQRQHPEFLLRFPQYIIASYLGMTKETLSRVRSQAVKK